MNQISLPWGRDERISFDLPRGWRLKGVLEPRLPDNCCDVGAELKSALAAPIGAPLLHEFAARGKSAAVVVDDRTRPTPVAEILPSVVAELNRGGIPDERIVVVIALGTHRFMTEEEIGERLGPEMARRLRVVNHDFQDRSMLVPAGTTPRFQIPCSFNRHVMEAEVVVSIGCIEAHEMAGVGGGYKNLMPGVSDAGPIYHTHRHRFQRPPRISSSGMPKSRCRHRQAVDECGALLGPKVFIVNTVMGGSGVAAVVAGDPLQAHDAGRAIYERMAEVRLESGPADVVISDARPLDVDLRVTLKSCFNSSAALKPGGTFICVSRTLEGIGDLRLPERIPAAARHVIKAVPPRLIRPLARKINVSPDQAVGTVSLLTMLHDFRSLHFLTSFAEGPEAFRNLGMKFHRTMDELLAAASKERPEAEVLVLPHGGASFVAWD